jgi:esterase/lipase superfamily enzyme
VGSITFYEETLDPKKHFTIKSVDVRPVEEWMNLVSSSGMKTALVFVHGFHTTFRRALYLAGQIFWDLQYSGVPVLFSWPSRGAVLDYVYDMNSAMGKTGEAFIELLRRLRSAGVSRIDILAHSMGNLAVLNSLANHQRSDDPLGIAEILMAAPDVDRDNYISLATKVRSAVAGMTLYASSADGALTLSKWIAGNIVRAGDVPAGGPVLVDGIDAIDVTAIGEDLFGHSAYATTVSILSDISNLIAYGVRPPNRRAAVEIRGMPKGKSPPAWWRFIPQRE